MTSAETGKPSRSASATAFSTSAWLLQRLADIQGPKAQSGGRTGGAEEGEILRYHALRRAGKEGYHAAFRQFCDDLALPEVKSGALAGVRIEPEAAVRPEEGRGAVGLAALEAELLLHLADGAAALLVEGVESLAEAVGPAVVEGNAQACAPLAASTSTGRAEGGANPSRSEFESFPLSSSALDAARHEAGFELFLGRRCR